MNDLTIPELPVTQELHRPMTTGELLTQSQLIHDVLTKVMVDGIHYGKIPGTGDKPTLYLAGAEKIDATFRLAPKYEIEDLCEPHNNFYRYRAKCSLYTIRDGYFVGSAVGEASSAEEKYMWERAVCDEQWESLPSDQRRIKWKKDKATGEVTQIKQIRTNAADIANTVLKIATKRAHVSASKGATAASDILEVDFDEEAVQDLKRKEQDEAPQQEAPKPKAKAKPAPKLPFGRSKHKAINDPSVPVDDLKWMRDAIAAKLDDPSREKWKANDQALIQALDAELAARAKAAPAEQTDQREPMRDEEWAQFTMQMDTDFHDAYVKVKAEFKAADMKAIPGAARWAFYDRIQQLIAG